MHAPSLRARAALFAALAFLSPVGPLAAAPVISEFMALNSRTLVDEDGAASDYIEIRNVGATAADLGGYRLTDESGNLSKWVFPSRAMPGNSFLVVFASGKNRAPAVGELHTNFSLNGNGEYLALVDPGGTVVTQFNPYPEQFEDISFGSSSVSSTQKVLPSGAPCRWLVPSAAVDNWQAEAFNDSAWTPGTTGVGYDLDTEYTALIGAGSNVQARMYNLQTSVYVRVPFTIPSVENLVGARIRMRYDDGFQAFLNGSAAAAGNVVLPLQWNASTTFFHPDVEALVFEDFNASGALPALHAGINVLAIQGVNQIPGSSDLLVMPEIELDFQDPDAPALNGYMPMPTPGTFNARAFTGFVKDTVFSIKRGFFSEPFGVTIASATPGVEIRYTTDSSEPTLDNGTVFSGPIPITTTTVLRAAAFKPDYVPTNIDTQTYIFPAAVKAQSATQTGYPTQWLSDDPDPAFPSTPVPADYGMDESVVTSPAYSGVIESALKDTLPVVAITTPVGNLFGAGAIYYEGAYDSTDEVPVSLEYFDPHGTDDFHQNAGLRLHGGNARTHPKKPLRLYFRRSYGKGKLEFPLFAGSPVDSFDQLILRPGGHDGWAVPFGGTSFDLAYHATYMRDQFMRRTENDMGLLSPYGKYVHLYLNGLYWGVYDLHERPNAQYFADHLGGGEEDYDVLHHRSTVAETFTLIDGDAAAYSALQSLAQNGINTPADYAAIQQYIDLDNFIDSMITRIWSGDWDWDGPMFLQNLANPSEEADVTYFTNKNWYAGRKSRNGEGKFHFFSWDAEMSMGLHLMANLNFTPQGTPAWFGQFPPHRIPNFDLTRAGTFGAPTFPYSALRNYPPFRIRFGDRLRKHFFNDGKMTAAANLARFAAMESQLQTSIVAESARWGDVNGISFTRNDHWQPEVDWLKNSFLPGRTATVLGQFRAIGLYPATEPSTPSSPGGPAPVGTQITLSAPSGEIYYTLDGSDPYIPAVTETLTLVASNSPVRTLIPSVANGGAALAGTWKGASEPFNTSGWTLGTQGVGYETAGLGYTPFINANVGAMQNVNGSVFVRLTYSLTSQSLIDSLKSLVLRVRYDDGFVAYLRGTEVARRNSPTGIPAWDALASAIHEDSEAVGYESFDLTSFKGEIRRSGSNVLSFHAMNQALDSSDLLLQAELLATRDLSPAMPSPTAVLYTGTPVTLNRTGVLRSRVRDTTTGVWSALTETQYLVGSLAAPGNIVVSEMLYRPREPIAAAETSLSTNRDDYEFIELLNVSGGTIDLTNLRFSQGITFSFSGGTLAPGQKVLVVRDRAAFLARYGAALDPLVAGEFENGTGLSNGGERVTLTDALGQVIHTFVYDDAAPWPSVPNDYGHSLVLANPGAGPDHNNPAHWMSSLDPGGTPGGFAITGYDAWSRIYFDPAAPDFDLVSDPMTDVEGDGWANLLEYSLLTDPMVSDLPQGNNPPVFSFVSAPGGTYMALTFRQRPQAGADFACGAETATNLTNWEPNTTEVGTAIANPDGSITRTFRANAPRNAANPNAQMRVTATAGD